jgi:hypothetical protein
MVDPLALRRFGFLFGGRRTGNNGIRRSFFESALFVVEER